MKVVDRSLDSGAPAESGRTHETQRAAGTAEGTGTSRPKAIGDQVEFSSTLGSLARAMSSLSATHAAKVQALAAQYRSGAYQADSLVTSRTMIAHALTAGDD